MASFNKVMLMGNLTKDPELRYIPSGAAVSTLRIAVSHQWRSPQGEAKKETSFVDVVVWTKLAENCARFLKKGSPIFVEGRLRIREYVARGEESGRKRYATEIVANSSGSISTSALNSSCQCTAITTCSVFMRNWTKVSECRLTTSASLTTAPLLKFKTAAKNLSD